MFRRTLLGLAVLTGAGLAVPSPASAAEPQADGTRVTLVMGETVTVSASGDVVAVTRDGKRTDVAIRKGPSGVSAIPAGAGEPLAEGRADPGLFNVTQLVAQGYDDAHRPELPGIARNRSGATVRTSGVRRSRRG